MCAGGPSQYDELTPWPSRQHVPGRADGAARRRVEMTRRLRDSNDRLAKVNTCLVGVVAFVTIVGGIVPILQLLKR